MHTEKFNEIYYQSVCQDRAGFYALKPSFRKNVQEFYANEYFQNDSACYQKTDYDPIDMEYKRNCFAQKILILDRLSAREGQFSQKCLLDIGCGEGFALSYFDEMGWDVTGIDLAAYALELHNPHMRSHFLQGDISETIEKLVSAGRIFDFLNLDNVFEHVPEPQKLLADMKHLCKEDSIICIQVPNDFSLMQRLADQTGQIDRPFWVTEKTCEHINYFSVESLTKLGEGLGYEKIFATADWPIDFFLLNPASNYYRNKELGHDCHIACAALENALCRQSMERALDLHAALADAGIGRNISVYFKPHLI